MTCEKFAEMLDNYESLSDEERALMSEHAAQCEECGHELDFMRSVINSVRTLPELKVPDDFLEKLNARIDAEGLTAKRGGIVGHMRYNWQKYSAAAACLLIAAVIGANYDMLTDRMNGNDSGVISEVTAVSSPAPRSTGNAAPAGTTKASPLDDGTVVGDVAGRISPEASSKSDEKTDSDTSTVRPNVRESGFVNSTDTENAKSAGGTDVSRRAAGSSQSGESGTGSVQSRSVIAQAENTPSYSNPQPVTEAESEARQTSAPASEQIEEAEEKGDEYQTMTLPRGVYVESRGAGRAVPEPENTEDEPNPYEISEASETDGYAAVSGEYTEDDDGGADEDDDDGLGYELNQSNMIAVRGEDFAMALDVISQYASDCYSNYFMVTSGNIDAMLAALDEAGVYYHDNIAVDTDKITFRISIE